MAKRPTKADKLFPSYAMMGERESPPTFDPSPLFNGGLPDSFIDLADIQARLARIERILNASMKVMPPLGPKRVIYTPGPAACNSGEAE